MAEVWETNKNTDFKEFHTQAGGLLSKEHAPFSFPNMFQDKKFIDALIEYIYYNNPDEDDEFAPNHAPLWIIAGSSDFLKSKGVRKIYRGISQGSYKGEDAYSWTYKKKVAKNFGNKILEKSLPLNIISPEFVFSWAQQIGYAPLGASEHLLDFIRNFRGGEYEVILAKN